MCELPLVQIVLPHILFSGEREKKRERRVCARVVSKKWEQSACKQSSASSAEREGFTQFFQHQQEKSGGRLTAQ
jgi:predicted kinase